jgi:hypothetical protein
VDSGEFRHQGMVKLDGTADFIEYFFDTIPSLIKLLKSLEFSSGDHSAVGSYMPHKLGTFKMYVSSFRTEWHAFMLILEVNPTQFVPYPRMFPHGRL